MHGKVSRISHDGTGILEGVPIPFTATRYHSLIVERDTLPEVLVPTAWTEDGLIMAMHHRRCPIFGVQFHPESIASQHGHRILANFLAIARGSNAPARGRLSRTRVSQRPQTVSWRDSPPARRCRTTRPRRPSTSSCPARRRRRRSARLLMAMRVRGETVAEITGAVRAMRARMTAVAAPPDAIDVCGTGGDAAGTLNVSTAVTFVVAGCGVPVAKHGNRALSSRTGGADVLTALGVNIDAPLERLPDILREAGCVFLFAPRHHPSMRHAAGPRVELGTRTIFNLLGPLANPARVQRQLTGVFSPDWARPMAETLGRSGQRAAWMVHGQGLDELTVAGENQVAAWKGGQSAPSPSAPEDAGLPRAPIAAISGGDAAFNAAALQALLQGATGAYRDTVLLNAAAALIVAGRAADLRDGVASGGARRSHPAPRLPPWRRCDATTAAALKEADANDAIHSSGSDVLARICADTRAAVARARRSKTSLEALRADRSPHARRRAARLRRGAEGRGRRRAATG